MNNDNCVEISSFIREIIVRVARKEVVIEMPSGTYLYKNVPSEIAGMFVVAESKGEFFNAFIKNRYAYEKIL